VALNETWLDDDLVDIVKIPGYELVHKAPEIYTP